MKTYEDLQWVILHNFWKNGHDRTKIMGKNWKMSAKIENMARQEEEEQQQQLWLLVVPALLTLDKNTNTL